MLLPEDRRNVPNAMRKENGELIALTEEEYLKLERNNNKLRRGQIAGALFTGDFSDDARWPVQIKCPKMWALKHGSQDAAPRAYRIEVESCVKPGPRTTTN